MEDAGKKCFVCEKYYPSGETSVNKTVMLPVCKNCIGTAEEKQKEEEYLDSLADGLVCCCI